MATSKKAKDEAPVEEVTPTIEEAKAMFEENPGLSAVLTDQGFLHRDGSLPAQ